MSLLLLVAAEACCTSSREGVVMGTGGLAHVAQTRSSPSTSSEGAGMGFDTLQRYGEQDPHTIRPQLRQ